MRLSLYIFTGESVPQMKEALAHIHSNSVDDSNSKTLDTDSDSTNDSDGNSNKLDMNGMNRVNVLFSGSSLITVDGGDNANVEGGSSSNKNNSNGSIIPNAPDNGALAYVLRTGFGSSQGALLQMIEFSQQSVAGDVKETGMALLLLFVFALCASGYVLKEGLRKKEKTTHELLLKCIIIITSVVPRQFPMQVINHSTNI